MSDPKAVDSTPSLYVWAGGKDALEKLVSVFYAKVSGDPILAPVFARMGPEHPKHVAAFIGEVFGGPEDYSRLLGGHAGMVTKHLGKQLDERQRRRWIELLVDSADQVGMPDDPEFRSAFVGYLEWGTRLAVINSQPGVKAPPPDSQMPKWGWGPTGGPYKP